MIHRFEQLIKIYKIQIFGALGRDKASIFSKSALKHSCPILKRALEHVERLVTLSIGNEP